MLNVIRTGLDAANQEISVLSHNIANANTTGFKRSNAVFEDQYGEVIGLRAESYTGNGTKAHAPRQNHNQGELRSTGGALDMAVIGRGYFMVEKLDEPGGKLFTRDGAFQLDDNGTITNSLGQPMLSNLGEKIQIPLAVNLKGKGRTLLSEIQLDPQGELKAVYGPGEIFPVGRVGLARFINNQGLAPRGLSQFGETKASGNPIVGAGSELGFGKVENGHIEMANTKISDELVSMIRAQQSFSGMSRIMQAEVDMVKRFSQS